MIAMLFPLLDSSLCMFLPYAFRELAGAGTLAASAECGTSAACWRCRYRQETLSQPVAAHFSSWADSKQSKGATSYELVPPRTGFPYKVWSFKEDNLNFLKIWLLKLWQLSFSVVCFPVRRNFLERRLVHTIIFSFPPGKLVGEGTFLLLRKKQRNKVMIWSLGLVIAYRGLVLHKVSDNICEKGL